MSAPTGRNGLAVSAELDQLGEAIEERLSGLDQIGAGADGFTRLAWSEEDAESMAWFKRQAAELGLTVERDRAGNLWATPDVDPPWLTVGSHLDTVRDGGRYDGALGVACAFEISSASDRPLAVVSFADEEGGRYNSPTFGSRALVGRLDVAEALERTDANGVSLRQAMAEAGVDPDLLAAAPDDLSRVQTMIEIHIDQSRELFEAGVPAGVVSSLASRMRLAIELTGEADHAGTTRREERRDAMAAAARLIVSALELAEPHPGFVVTPGKLLVEPNAPTTVPARVQLWLDARATSPEMLNEWREELVASAELIAAASRVEIAVETAAHSQGVLFDQSVREALQRAATANGSQTDEVVCFAGHDAGVIGEQRPAGMVLVRNERGISHSGAEFVELSDAAAATKIVIDAIKEL